jgi:hypothetical protein
MFVQIARTCRRFGPSRTKSDAAVADRCPVGVLLLFNGGPETKASLDRLQRASAMPLWLPPTSNGRGGRSAACLVPHAMAFGLGGSANDCREARCRGIHSRYPVAGVNTNPGNPIIATRAFSAPAGRRHSHQLPRRGSRGGWPAPCQAFPRQATRTRTPRQAAVGVAVARQQLCELCRSGGVDAAAAGDDGPRGFPAVDQRNAATLSRRFGQVLRNNSFRGVSVPFYDGRRARRNEARSGLPSRR